MNHLLGQYVMIAINNPKEYPQHAFLYEPPLVPDEEVGAILKRLTLRLNGKVK